MARYLVASTALPGHVAPLLALATHLHRRGHEVVFHSGSTFAAAASERGLRFVPFLPAIDYDHRDFRRRFPEWETLPSAHARLCYGLRHAFADAMPAQLAGLDAILADFHADAVLVDSMFCGALALHQRGGSRPHIAGNRGGSRPLIAGSRGGSRPPIAGKHGGSRPPIVGIGISALALCSADTAFFGTALPPAVSAPDRARNLAMNRNLQQALFGAVQQHFDDALAALQLPPLPCFFIDAMIRLPERYLQLTVPGFEYPRADLPSSVRFVGSLLAPPSRDFTAPPWWADLDDGRKVVLVTQGTLANQDTQQLIEPTLRGLSLRQDLLVIATTGSSEPPRFHVPANARVAGYVPYDRLLPKVDVLISNGGYGSVNHALSLGVPLVVAGDSEEKPEIAARVAWSGTGINLGTGRPSPRQIAEAVERVLTQPGFRSRAGALRSEFLRYDALAMIEAELEALAAGGDVPQPATVSGDEEIVGAMGQTV